MGVPSAGQRAGKRTVSLTLNADLYARAKELGINISKVAEEALADKLKALAAEKIKTEIRQDLAAYNAYVDKHGSPADLIRAHYADPDAV